MTKKFALALLCARHSHSRSARPPRWPASGRAAADPGVTDKEIVLGATTPLSGPFSSVSSVTHRRERLLQVRERERRRERPQDHVQVPRRPVRPGEDGAAHAAARRAGQGLRDLQLDRDRAQPRDPRLPEREQGAAAVRRLRVDDARPRRRAVPVGDRVPAELPGRGLGVRQVPRPDAARARRSRCSSRTTTTARICSAASSAGCSGRR